MKPPRTAGRRIKAARLELGLSQRRAATNSVTFAYLSRLEAEERRPSWSALIELAHKLGTTALYLAYGTEDRTCPVCDREPPTRILTS